MRWIAIAFTSARFLAITTSAAFLCSYYLIIAVHKLPRVRLPFELQLVIFLGFTWLAWYVAEYGSDRLQRGVGFFTLYLLGALSFFALVKSA